MTPQECAAEALKRLKDADELFNSTAAARAAADARDHDGIGNETHLTVCHLRQTAAVYATLALVPRGTLQP